LLPPRGVGFDERLYVDLRLYIDLK